MLTNVTSFYNVLHFEHEEEIKLPNESSIQRVFTILLSFWMLMIAIIGFFGNGLIAYVFARKNYLRKKYFYIIVISILYAFGSLFFTLNSYHIYFYKIMKDPICTIHAFAISTLSVGGIHQLTVLSFERFIGVKYPFISMKLALRTKIFFVIGAFTWTLFTTAPPLFGWSRYKVLDDSLHYCVFDYLSKERLSRLYILYLFINAYIIPLIIIGFSNYKIFLTTKGMIKTRKSDIYKRQFYSKISKSSNNSEISRFYSRVSKSSINSDVKTELYELGKVCANSDFNDQQFCQLLLIYNKQQKKCARVIFYCVGSFIISWTPYAFTSIVWNIIFNFKLNQNIVLLTAIAAKMFVIWNPIIYGFMDQTFRNECSKIFKKLLK